VTRRLGASQPGRLAASQPISPGRLAAWQACSVATHLGPLLERIARQRLKLCRMQIDKDGDGQISYAEFHTLVKSLENERGGLRPKVRRSCLCAPAAAVARSSRARRARAVLTHDVVGHASRQRRGGCRRACLAVSRPSECARRPRGRATRRGWRWQRTRRLSSRTTATPPSVSSCAASPCFSLLNVCDARQTPGRGGLVPRLPRAHRSTAAVRTCSLLRHFASAGWRDYQPVLGRNVGANGKGVGAKLLLLLCLTP
jgi:hypothetical protein